jgi:MFS family permease
MAPTSPPRSSREIYDADATESTPLLNGTNPVSNGVTADSHSREENGLNGARKPADKPLPLMQIFLLCYARMMEPIAFFSIFPFIAQMVQRNGNLPVADVGFYSGLIESLFSATQMMVLIFWGKLADKLGRKPILIYSLVGMAIGPALFGMAASLWQMILFRCLAGVFSGSTLIIRTMISDHSTPKTQARAFSWFAFAGNMGIFLGPVIGGVLAEPATQYPGLFKGWTFFEKYPYSLPGFVIAFISMTGVVTSVLFLEETLDKEKKLASNTTATKTADPPPSNGEENITQEMLKAGWENMSILQLLKAPGILNVLWVYGHVMLLAFAFTALVPVYLYTPVGKGGLGFTTFQNSMYMAVQGASQALWLLLAFPSIHARIGTKKLMYGCAILYPAFFAGYIFLNEMLRIGTEAAMVWFWIALPMVAIVGPGVSMAFTGCQLALNDASPNAHVLGTLNGIALSVASGLRSVAPVVTTAGYAVGVRNNILDGHLVWVVLIPLSLALWFCLPRLPNDTPTAQMEDSQE